MSKYALVSMMGNVGSTTNSQGGGYGLIATKMVKDYFPEDQVDVNVSPEKWQDYDALFICEGVNFVPGSFNVPGGPQPLHYEKMKAIGNYKGIVKFINNEFDFEGFNKRLKIEDLNFPVGNFVDLFNSYGNKTRKCVVGDSHALSVWRPKYSLNFTPGRTLHGFLKRNTPELMNEVFDETITYFSNIDIRFHLMRQNNPEEATIDLFSRYVEFSAKLKNNIIVEPLPIEHESRKIPGTGLYKKQPFFGTRLERMKLRSIAIDIIRNSGQKYISWPENWICETGEKMLDILEQKQSVHLRPKYYPHINEIIS